MSIEESKVPLPGTEDYVVLYSDCYSEKCNASQVEARMVDGEWRCVSCTAKVQPPYKDSTVDIISTKMLDDAGITKRKPEDRLPNLKAFE